MHYFNCVCLKDFFRKKIIWINEKLTKEQFVEVRGTRLRVSLRSLATPWQAIYEDEFESSRLRVSPFGLLATPWRAAGFARQISEPALARVAYGSRAA